MVDPAWFFSTLAQATAASIGFLIAFLAALYTARKNKTQDNYREFMNQLQQIETNYKPLLRQMQKQLVGVTDFPVSDGTIEETCEIDLSQSKIEDIAEEYDQPTAVRMWANLNRSQKILDQIILPQPNNKKRCQLQRLNESSKAMIDQIDTAASAFELLGDTSIGHLEPEEVRNKEVFPEVVDDESVVVKGTYPKTDTFQSWETVLSEFRQQTVRAAMWTQNSELTVDFDEFKIALDQILTLFFIGVALPMLFLLSWVPDWWVTISGLTLIIIEIAFILAVSYHTVALFRTVKSILTYSNRV
jgi:hypothetical protein